LAANALAGFDQPDPIILAPASASAQLIAAGLKLNFAGRGAITLPSYLTSGGDAGGFVQEGNPIPTKQLSFTQGAILEPRTFCVITTFVREVTEATNIEAIVREILSRASAAALDAAILSTTAGDLTRPAGILAGVAATPASAASGTPALVADVGA